MDVGDVLIRTVPMAHYRALGRHAGLGWERVAELLKGSGVVTAFETGRLAAAEFTHAVREMLAYPSLPDADVREAWNTVVAEVDPAVAPAAARLAAAGRLLLASNTNPFHWQVVRHRLARAGIVAPACLSFEIGCAKPDLAFFVTLTSAHPDARSHAVYVDDRAANVEAAVRCGMAGLVHSDPTHTAERLGGSLI